MSLTIGWIQTTVGSLIPLLRFNVLKLVHLIGHVGSNPFSAVTITVDFQETLWMFGYPYPPRKTALSSDQVPMISNSGRSSTPLFLTIANVYRYRRGGRFHVRAFKLPTLSVCCSLVRVKELSEDFLYEQSQNAA